LKEEEFSTEGMSFGSFSVGDGIQNRVGNKPGESRTQKMKRKEDIFEVVYGKYENSVLETSGCNAQITKGGFIVLVPIYGNAIPVSFALIVQNIQIFFL
jgi:hypothetical protein